MGGVTWHPEATGLADASGAGDGVFITTFIEKPAFAGHKTDAATGVIVHEWVERWGGAERVLEAMTQAFPDADVRVLWSDTPILRGREVTESWLARTPLRSHKALALPAMLPTWCDPRVRPEVSR